jgi:hypothetical protein
MTDLSPLQLASAWSLSCEFILLAALYPLHKWPGGRKANYVFFNPKDYATSDTAEKLKVQFPAETATAKFDSFVTQYTGMAKVTIGLAAASISFGGLKVSDSQIWTAKLLLAYSIAFSLFFCVAMINFYENYLHDLTSYKPWKAALVESCGLTSLFCFALGYWYWASHV